MSFSKMTFDQEMWHSLAAMSQQSFCNLLLVRYDSQPDDIQPNDTEQNELDCDTWHYNTKHDFMLCRIFMVML